MNNLEKNTYVKKRLTETLLMLLRQQKLCDISISQLTEAAGVGRVSFYRNYQKIEDILRQYDMTLIKAWGVQFEQDSNASVHSVFGGLFQHYKHHEDFYMLLYHNDLTEMILDTIREVSGPKPEMDNSEAYGKAFIAYGIYGWLLEWMGRGMQESAKEIDAFLSFPSDIPSEKGVK